MALTALLACTEGPPEALPTTDVVATIDQRHITVAELEHVLRQGVPGVEAEKVSAERRRAALADLVQMEAMAQLARAQGWDGDPAFEIDVQMATRRALAAEPERRALRALPPPTPEQVRRFIDGNPQVFSARQWFTLEELSLPLPAADVVAALDNAQRKGASIEVLARLLRDAQLTPIRRVTGAGTEQLPQSVSKALLDAGPGKPLILRPMPDRLAVTVLHGVMPAPIGGVEAERVAYRLLQDLQRRRAAQQQIQQAVAAVSIQYHGEFGTAGNGASASTANQAALPAGRPTPGRQTTGDAVTATLGMAVGAALMALTLLLAIRHEIGRLWLPSLGFLRAPAPLPEVSVLSEATPPNDLFNANPSLWSDLGRFPMWFAWVTGLIGLSVLVFRQSAVQGLGITAASLALGLLLGVLAAHAFARSPLRTRTRSRTWLPVLVLALVWLGLNAGLLWATL